MAQLIADKTKTCPSCRETVWDGAGKCLCGIRFADIAELIDAGQLQQPAFVGSDDGPVAHQPTTVGWPAGTPSSEPRDDGNEIEAVLARGREAYTRGHADVARESFGEAASRGSVDARFFLGVIADERDDGDEARRCYRQAADAGHALAALCLGTSLWQAGDVPGALASATRARELGNPMATGVLALYYAASGDDSAAERVFEEGVAEGDPECAYALATRRAKAHRGTEMEGYLTQYAKLAVERELRDEAWAHVEDFTALTDEQLNECEAQADRWKQPYHEIVVVIRDQGPGALRRPVGDPERAAAAMEFLLNWGQRCADERRARATRARAESARAHSARDAPLRSHDGVESSGTATYGSPPGWRGEPVEIANCRILSDADSTDTTTNVTLQFAREAAIVVRPASEFRALAWADIRRIRIEALPDRSRITAPRAAGLGLLSLGAKKRTPWCALTIDCRQGHLVCEIPTEAHRLRAIFASAGVDAE